MYPYFYILRQCLLPLYKFKLRAVHNNWKQVLQERNYNAYFWVSCVLTNDYSLSLLFMDSAHIF
jgi:hypothetical protein